MSQIVLDLLTIFLEKDKELGLHQLNSINNYTFNLLTLKSGFSVKLLSKFLI